MTQYCVRAVWLVVVSVIGFLSGSDCRTVQFNADGYGTSLTETHDIVRRQASPCDSFPCLNGGTCNATSSTAFECTCVPGNWGTTCNMFDACFAGPCQNGATCNRVSNTYTCTCALGYTGMDCDEDINDCLSAPCINGGMCTDTGPNSFDCECLPGFYGNICSNMIFIVGHGHHSGNQPFGRPRPLRPRPFRLETILLFIIASTVLAHGVRVA